MMNRPNIHCCKWNYDLQNMPARFKFQRSNVLFYRLASIFQHEMGERLKENTHVPIKNVQQVNQPGVLIKNPAVILRFPTPSLYSAEAHILL